MDVLLKKMADYGLESWADALAERIEAKERYIGKVDVKGRRYLQTFSQLPDVFPSSLELDADWVRIGQAQDLRPDQRQALLGALQSFGPWRKGPFNLFGIEIDSEWVSYLKWNRVKDCIAPLAGRRVLDVGSSCGYYLFRMAAARPQVVLGIEPYLTFYFQYRLLQHYARLPDVHCLPLKLEEFPAMKGYFDTIFCMGILYHRRSPIDSLKEMRENLRRGGELVLETLVIEGEGELALFPEKRYAKMNNVYFIPTVRCLSHWLKRAGFENIRCVDTTRTTLREQRKTEWVNTESLDDFLDPEDPSKTVEGYPGPVRSILIANAR